MKSQNNEKVDLCENEEWDFEISGLFNNILDELKSCFGIINEDINYEFLWCVCDILNIANI